MRYILYNPAAGNGTCEKEARELAQSYSDAVLIDLHKVTGYRAFFEGLSDTDSIILCGGDGTLHHFINDTVNIDIQNDVYYYAVGSGNDFARDLGKERGSMPSFPINAYIKRLPSVTVNGKRRLFINGVGFGIDGYCCEVGDSLREKNGTGQPINYTAIAIKGLLFHYKPTKATVTVDGESYTYDKAWLCPTMHGRYYGGGMMPTPCQNRDDGKLSVMIFHGSGKLKTLAIFPSIFKGGHVKHTGQVTVLRGNEITVTFDAPRALQIDGETVRGVYSYTASACMRSPHTETARERCV